MNVNIVFFLFFFLMDKALSSISQTDYGQLVKMLITLEPHDIFRSKFAYIFFLFFNCLDTGRPNVTRLCRASFWSAEVFR